MSRRKSQSEKIVEKIRVQAQAFNGHHSDDRFTIEAQIKSRTNGVVTKVGTRTRREIFCKKACGLAGNSHFELFDETAERPIEIPWNRILRVSVVARTS